MRSVKIQLHAYVPDNWNDTQVHLGVLAGISSSISVKSIVSSDSNPVVLDLDRDEFYNLVSMVKDIYFRTGSG